MTKEARYHYPKGALKVVHMGEHQWTFEYPRISWEILEVFHEALEFWRAGLYSPAEEAYHQLIHDFPEFIDVHHHLALILDRTGREREAFRVWKETVAMGLACLPENFEIGQDLLPWVVLENRPFLRAYHALGLEYLERGQTKKALEIFNNILSINPNDNQGIRALAIECHFLLSHPVGVLEICERYPGDMMEQVVYGQVLALYQLGQEREAEAALHEAIEFLPLVAQELARRYHPRPKNLHENRVTHGGADQAYYYWKDYGQYWKNTPGAIPFVQRHLADNIDPAQSRFDAWYEQHHNPETIQQAQTLPLRRDMVTLLEYVSENKVVGTQSTGNMPLKAVREVTARFVNPPQLDTSIGERVYRLRSEEDVWPLYFLHILAEVGDLLAIAPGRRWRVTAGGQEFLHLEPLLQATSLLTTWWYEINWLVAYPLEGMGTALPYSFSQITLAHLRSQAMEKQIPFKEFANALIAEAGLTWGRGDSDYAAMLLQSSIKRMVIDVLKRFGLVECKYREEPLGKGTTLELDSFEITAFGQALLEVVNLASD